MSHDQIQARSGAGVYAVLAAHDEGRLGFRVRLSGVSGWLESLRPPSRSTGAEVNATDAAGIPCSWCGSTAPSHQQHGCGHVHCPFSKIDLTTFINAADISAADFPHIVVEKLQKAIDAARGRK